MRNCHTRARRYGLNHADTDNLYFPNSTLGADSREQSGQTLIPHEIGHCGFDEAGISSLSQVSRMAIVDVIDRLGRPSDRGPDSFLWPMSALSPFVPADALTIKVH